jgi:hypothetical protein
MTKTLLAAGILVSCVATSGADLFACGDKFLVVSRGTRFQRASVARQPARILVYTNPTSTLPKALEKAAVDATLRKAGYQPTSVSGASELDQAIRQGGWDVIVADLADSSTVRGRIQGADAPMVLPVVLNATGTELAQAKKDYQRVLKGPIKSQAFLEAIDDAVALREKLRTRPAA